MKSMTKLMVVAMILAAALVVAPVAAARNVTSGSTIYVGEDDLVLNATGGPLFGHPDGYLVKFSSLTDRIVVGTPIRVTNATNFDLTSAAVGQNTGVWYAFSTTNFSGDYNGTVFIENPRVDLDVRIAGTSTSLNERSVTRGQSVDFRLDHNLGGLLKDDIYNGMEIRVTTPGGGTTTILNDTPLTVNLTSSQVDYVRSISMADLPLGTYTAQAVWRDNSADLTDSNTVTFEVTTGALAIEADKDTVVRGNSFSVTITGESRKYYDLTITSTTNALSPVIAPGQVDVDITSSGRNDYNARVRTDAAGTRTVQFNTNESTRDATYTIRVTDPTSQDRSTYEEVRVKVEAGAITITTSGTGTYYVGEEIVLSGTNTDSEFVYLFVTGPNLGSNGVGLTGNMSGVVDGARTGGNFTRVSVEGDDTWSYRWNTGTINRALTSGGYTVYAVSDARDREHLSDAKYATTTVQLRPGFITATLSGANAAKGEDVTITGTAQGNPDNVNVWIFGKNFYGAIGGNVFVDQADVESDGSFEFELDGAITRQLTAGQYFVIVQHPMGEEFEVDADGNSLFRAGPSGKVANSDRVFVAELTRLQAAEAANALIDALESPYVDDAYTKLTFFLEDAWVRIDPIGDQSAGSTFTITGTTNLAAGSELIVEVTSAAFQPGATGETTGFSSDAGTVIVQQGETANTWSFEVDGTNFRPDQYIVSVESIEAQTSTTGSFNVVEGPAPTPTGTETTTPTGTETPTPTGTTTTQATPTQSPGFGALVALAGLGAVAFLVLRRD